MRETESMTDANLYRTCEVLWFTGDQWRSHHYGEVWRPPYLPSAQDPPPQWRTRLQLWLCESKAVHRRRSTVLLDWAVACTWAFLFNPLTLCLLEFWPIRNVTAHNVGIWIGTWQAQTDRPPTAPHLFLFPIGVAGRPTPRCAARLTPNSGDRRESWWR
jgi:hypothetical protein